MFYAADFMCKLSSCISSNFGLTYCENERRSHKSPKITKTRFPYFEVV